MFIALFDLDVNQLFQKLFTDYDVIIKNIRLLKIKIINVSKTNYLETNY